MRKFNRLRKAESIKARYRQLAKIHHPDHGGDAETMQAITREYRAALKRIESGDVSETLKASLTPDEQSRVKSLKAVRKNGMVNFSMEWTGDIDVKALLAQMRGDE